MSEPARSPPDFGSFYSEALWRISAYEIAVAGLHRYLEPRGGHYRTEFVESVEIDPVPYYAGGAVLHYEDRVKVERDRDGCLSGVRSWLRDACLACGLAWPDLGWLTLPGLERSGGPETVEDIESLYRARLGAVWVRLHEQSRPLRRRYRELRARGKEGPQPEPIPLPDWPQLGLGLAIGLAALERREPIHPFDPRGRHRSPWHLATLGILHHWSLLLRLERGSSPGPLREALAAVREAVEAVYAGGRDFDEFAFLDVWALARTLYESWRADSIAYVERVRALRSACERLEHRFQTHERAGENGCD